MTSPISNPKKNNTKVKAALIPVLLCVLFFVLYEPEPPATGVAETASGSEDPAREATKPASEADLKRLLASLKKDRAPQMEFDEVVSYDPFQNLAVLKSIDSTMNQTEPALDDSPEPPGEEKPAAPKAKSLAEIKDLLQSRKVSAILHGTSENSAIIDAKVVHVGDLLEPGLRIVDIKSTGVVLRIEAD